MRSVAFVLGVFFLTSPLSAQPKEAKARFAVPNGFRVETVVAPDTKIEGESFAQVKPSFVNMCFDGKGRLLLSQERGPILLALDADKDGVLEKLRVYCDQVTNCQGMCWADGALYLVGDGPKKTGLYRCRDTKGQDRIDEVEAILVFKGGMGEHGPHAIIHGPDNMLYLVIGNHAWVEIKELAKNSPLTRWPKGQPGLDQGKPGTVEDVLLPRLNDANGHAANILAPGGTIWRLALDGKNLSLVAAGFRNHFDAAFNPAGELFTFDSDMEWDVELPWYRHVRVSHCPPGADFVWRTGAANTPSYYADSLPPLVETGRGSPTGVECYDHSAFPAKYRGALFLCDWSIGAIWVVHPERSGASYKASAEKFCTGTPMPVSDCVVGPDGALYFTLGGRGTQGSVHRIVHESAKTNQEPGDKDQPLAAWSKIRFDGASPQELLLEPGTPAERKARHVYLLGVGNTPGFPAAISTLLRDADPFVRRLACEACIRQNHEPALKDLKPLLADEDRFLRTAARLVLQRIDPKKWAKELIGDANDQVAHESIIALCKIDGAEEFAELIFERLHDQTPGDNPAQLLEWARTIQLALIHTTARPQSIRGIAIKCRDLFPTKDKSVNRELAILMTDFIRTKDIGPAGIAKMLTALKDAGDDRPQQIHFAYCLRLLKEGWTPEQRRELINWYEGTKDWTGGNSFNGFLQNIMNDASESWPTEEKKGLHGSFEKTPLTTMMLIRFAPAEQLPPPADLFAMLGKIDTKQARAGDWKRTLVESINRSKSPEVPAVLRKLADAEPGQRTNVARALVRDPSPENLPYIVQGLNGASGPILNELLDGLTKNPARPKTDDAAAFRAVIASAAKLQTTQKWKVVELLRHWTNNKSFGGEKKEEWKSELASWGKWYVQTFPKEPSLPDVASDKPAESKYKFAELKVFLDKDPQGLKGDPAKGKLAFTKANCIKCHKFGGEGEGLGPDLSAVTKRFKRSEILESIIDPSKVISDQYRSSTISTLDGRTFIGLAAEQGGMITILLQDANKIVIKTSDVESRFASLVSVMPEKGLDELTKAEIADLFAYLETAPPEKK